MSKVIDISPKLLQAIREDFNSELKNSKTITGLYDKVKKGLASYEEADDFAVEVGNILARAFQNNLSSESLPNGKMYYNIAKAVVEPMMVRNYDLVSSVTQQVQTSMNKSAGLGVKAIKPELNQDRIDGIINRISSAEDFETAKWVLAEPVVIFSQSIVTDAIKANAEFQYKAGLTPKIIRKTTGKCCDWCKEVSGTYEYPDVPKDVYRRHDYCRCKVDYVIGKYRENVHNGNTGKRRYVKDEYGGYVKSKEARIAHAKEMEATEQARKEAARAKRIATWEKKKTAGSIVNASESSKIKEITIHKGVGAAAKNYQVKMIDSKNHTRLAENQNIEGVTFAGKGTKTEIRERFRLESYYRIPADEWEKVSGKGFVVIDGQKRLAELHWYEAENEIYEMKIKRLLDED